MKKMLMTAGLLLASVVGLNAQSVTPRLEAGVAFSNARIKDRASSETMGIKIGARANAAAEINLTDPCMTTIYLAPGLTYKMGGHKDTSGILNTKTEVTTHEIGIPVNIGLRANFAQNMAVSVELGPYFSYALSGKAVATTTVLGKSVTAEHDLFSEKSGRNRFDAGLGISAALEVSRFYVRLGSEFGFINQIKNGSKDHSYLNNNFYTTIGFRF